MTYSYKVDDIPRSNNHYIGRTNYFEYQNDKKYWANLISVMCRPKPLKPINKAIVTLIYHFKDKRRRDPDNYSGKMILDGLTKSNIIEDDDFKHIQLVLEADFGNGKNETEIKIREIKESEKNES